MFFDFLYPFHPNISAQLFGHPVTNMHRIECLEDSLEQ